MSTVTPRAATRYGTKGRRAPLRVAVIGVGHLGSRHAQIYAGMPGVELVAVCDTDAKRAEALARELHCQALTNHRELIGSIDAASIAIPTQAHAQVALQLLRGGVHLLVEKPICTRLRDANALIQAAREHHCALQVGHVERFNAAIHTAIKRLKRPRFIEVHRLSPYPHRGTDVSVVLDVMIHDLDMLLALVRKPVTKIDALGVSVLSDSEDISNARLTFASGCVANLTASRISQEPIRRIRVFQEDSYLSIDYQAQTVELTRIEGNSLSRIKLPVNRRPPLQDELAAFIRSVKSKRVPLVTGEDGRDALALALRIERSMRRPSASKGLAIARVRPKKTIHTPL